MYLLDDDKKKKPTKGGPNEDNSGGPFVNKIIVIMKELRRRFNEWLDKRKEKHG